MGDLAGQLRRGESALVGVCVCACMHVCAKKKKANELRGITGKGNEEGEMKAEN